MKTIKFKSFSSGSCGNCYFLGIFDVGNTCECGILIDAGVSMRRLKNELRNEGLGLECLSCILVTHDHFDHIRSLGSYCKHLHMPVWSTPRLMNALSGHMLTGEYLPGCRHTLGEEWNDVVPGRIRAKYFQVPHDATQTIGYAIEIDGYNFVIMTDVGKVPEEAIEYASSAGTVVIESNYDPYMLEHGPYTPELQARIRSGHGHLSNEECAMAAREFAHDGLKHVFLCHLSEHNNTRELAFRATRDVLDPSIRVVALPRQTASPLFTLQLGDNC